MSRSLIFSLLILFSAKVIAQCNNGCVDISGCLIDVCFTDPDFDGKCAQFSEDSTHFFFQDIHRKKNRIVKIKIPEVTSGKVDFYLADLSNDRKLKLTTADILFIRKAIYYWDALEVIRKWDVNRINDGYTLLPTGLAYRMIEEGNGKKTEQGKNVTVHYTGYLSDGKKFDSSRDRKQTFTFRLGDRKVIQGWEDGISQLRVGDRVLLRIPPQLGYGSREIPGVIPPNSVLYFDIKVISSE